MKPLSIATTTLILGLFFILAPDPLQARMNLSPPLQEIELPRGGRTTFILTISNTGDEDVPSRFDIYNMDISKTGIPIVADSAYARGCADWIKLEPTECVIKAHETIEVNGTIRAPRQAEGGYYAIIKGTFTTSAPPIYLKEETDQSMIRFETKAAVVLMVSVPSSRSQAILVPDTLIIDPKSAGYGAAGLNSQLPFSPSAGWSVTLDLRNDGNIHTQAQAMASIWSEAGRKIGSTTLDAGRGYVLPGKIRRFSGKGKTALTDGNYMIRINIRSKDGKNLANSLPFTIYHGDFYPGSPSDKIAELVRASSPGYTLGDAFKEINVTPGGRSYGGCQVLNFIDDTLTLIARKVEWSVDDEGFLQLSNDPNSQPRSCSEWLHFSGDTLIIPPKRNSMFRYFVTLPESARGEYYSAIVFDRDSLRSNLPSEFYSQRAQLLVMSSRKGLTYSMEIDTFTVKKITHEEASIHSFGFVLTNNGSAHCYIQGSFSLSREVAHERFKPIGKPETFGGYNIYLMPGMTRKMNINVPNLEAGRYEASVIVSFQHEHQPAKRFRRFTLR